MNSTVISGALSQAEPRAKSQEPRAKSQEPRAKSQEPRAKSQEPRKKLAKAIHSKSLQTALSVVLLGGVCTVSADASEINEFSISSQSLNSALAQFSSQSGLQLVVNGDAVRALSAPALTGKLSNGAALSKLLSGTGLNYEFRNGDTVVIKVVEDTENDSSGKVEVDEEVVVTGSRLATDKSKIAGQVQTFDEAYIKASGETTLERFLRRLPQNFGGTSEFAGSNLNGANNFTGASTVNLRGLGDRATLILVDGHRRGFNGAVGGVTDISGIPLSQVERVEVYLDGASSIYGADAVGGVVNIITKRDYQGAIVGVEYTKPSQGGFDEYKFTFNGGTGWGSGSIHGSYEYYKHSGLLADDSVLGLTEPLDGSRDVNNPPLPGLLGQIAGFPGVALFYTGPGGNISTTDFAALEAADQALLTPVDIATLPAGFNESSPINDITNFNTTDNSVTGTGDADRGSLLLPERESHSFGLSLTQDLSDTTVLRTSLNYSTRDVVSGGASPSLNVLVSSGNPFNPIPRSFYRYSIVLPDLQTGRRFTNTDSDQWDLAFDLDGEISGDWKWHTEGTYSRSSTDSVRTRILDVGTIEDGTNSDGFSTERVPLGTPPPDAACTFVRISFGRDVYTCPGVTPINPFGDLSGFLLPEQFADNRNELTVLGADVKGTLFSLPAGDVNVAVGVEWQERKINSASEFAIGAQGLTVVTSVIGVDAFDASISRAQQAAYVEGAVPIFGEGNALPLIQALDFTFSGRYDSYQAADAVRSLDQSEIDLSDPVEVAEFEEFNTPSDIGGDSTWGAGFIWTLNDQLRLRTSYQTAFVAPQLNQLFSTTDPRFNLGFASLRVPVGTGIAILNFSNTLIGGNAGLKPENSRSKNVSLEYTPDFAQGLTTRITYAETAYRNRITRLSSNGATVTLDNLPSDVLLIPIPDRGGSLDIDADGNLVLGPTVGFFSQGDFGIQLDNRFTNAEQLNRSGLDYNLNYAFDSDFGDFNIDLTVSKTISHEFIPDAGDTAVSVVGDSFDPRFFAIPRYSANLQISWYYQGLNTSLSANARSSTKRFTLDSNNEIAFFRSTTSADTVNLTLAYDFGNGELFDTPEWLAGVNAIFGVENLTNEFSETTTTNFLSGETTLFKANPLTALGRGRVFNLRLQKEF